MEQVHDNPNFKRLQYLKVMGSLVTVLAVALLVLGYYHFANGTMREATYVFAGTSVLLLFSYTLSPRRTFLKTPCPINISRKCLYAISQYIAVKTCFRYLAITPRYFRNIVKRRWPLVI